MQCYFSHLLLVAVLVPLSLMSVYLSSSVVSTQGRPSRSLRNALLLAISANGTGDITPASAAESKKRIREESGQFHVQLSVPEPVIVVGYPKSGTTSVWHYFNCSGVVAQHYCSGQGETAPNPPCKQTMAACILKNMKRMNNRRVRSPTLLEGCGNFQVYAQIDGERPILNRRPKGKQQGPRENENITKNLVGSLNDDGTINTQIKMRHFLPQHFNLNLLHDHNPNATYLLPLRDPNDWAYSVYRWFRMRYYVKGEYRSLHHDNDHSRSNSFFAAAEEEPFPSGGDSNRSLLVAAASKRQKEEEMIRWLEQIYSKHTEYVRKFVRKHPSHVLVELNVSDSDEAIGRQMSDTFFAGRRLANSARAECWGHRNKREEHDKLTS